MDKDIGRIVEVRGVNVKAKLFKLLPPYLVNEGKVVSAPKINSFVKAKVGLDTIICQINGEYNLEKDSTLSDYYIDLTVKGYIENDKFIQGLRMLPIVSSNISLLSNKEYSIIYDYDKSVSFKIGMDLFEINKGVYLNFNNLIPSHIGIFGNTGSGKSNTLSNIYSNYLKKINAYDNCNAKVLLFDLNNEYGHNSICREQDKRVYKLSTSKESNRKIPFDFKCIDEDVMCTLLNASAKTQTPTIKVAYKQMTKKYDENYYVNYITNIIDNKQKDLFFAIRFRLSDYIENIQEIKWFGKKENQNFYIERENGTWLWADDKLFKDDVINKIKIILPEDPLDRFEFELCFAIAKQCDHGINAEFLLPLLNRADKIFYDLHKVMDFNDTSDLFDNKNLCVIQLGEVNNDMTLIIPSLLSNVIFNNQVKLKDESKINTVVNIVLDEAHNILFKDEDSILQSRVLYNFERIVKEGRKFGLFLTVSSQRPSDISSTVISQLHNYFIHKLVNPNDIYQIRKTVAFLDESALNFLTILAPGECIVSGTAVNMPIFLKVDELDKETKPNSEGVVLFGENGIIKQKKEDKCE